MEGGILPPGKPLGIEEAGRPPEKMKTWQAVPSLGGTARLRASVILSKQNSTTVLAAKERTEHKEF
jgi:hypothetical protein